MPGLGLHEFPENERRAQRTLIPGHDQAAFLRKHNRTRDLSRVEVDFVRKTLVVFGMKSESSHRKDSSKAKIALAMKRTETFLR